MTLIDAITEPEKITETLARLGIESTGPPKAMRSSGDLITFMIADDDEVGPFRT